MWICHQLVDQPKACGDGLEVTGINGRLRELGELAHLRVQQAPNHLDLEFGPQLRKPLFEEVKKAIMRLHRCA